MVDATPDSTGDVKQTVGTTFNRFASIQPLTAREIFSANQVQSDITHKIIVRASGLSLNPKMTILFGSRLFNIHSVLNKDEKGEMLTILCKEKV